MAMSLTDEATSSCSCHKRPFEFYCDSCKLVLCLECCWENHRDHPAFAIKKTFDRHKEEIEAAFNALKNKSQALSEARNILVAKVDDIAKNKKVICENIFKHSQEIVDSVTEARDQLVAQVNTSTEVKLQTLGQLQDRADVAYLKLEHCEEGIKKTLSGSVMEIMSNKSKLMDEMAALCNEVNPNAFQPTEEANLSFVENKEVINCCRSIGQVEFVSITNLTPNAPLSRFIPGTVTVRTQTLQHAPYNVELSASLITSGVNKLVNACMEGEAAGQYTLRFTPLTQRDKLQLMANDVSIQGSPFPLEVNSRNNTLHNIAGLTNPWGLAVDNASQLLVVAERGKEPCLTLFDHNRERIRSIRSNRQLINPCGMAFARDGLLIVSDNHRVQKVTLQALEGQCLHCIGDTVPGDGEEQFHYPRGLAVHPETGQILVADSGNHRIQVINEDFTYHSTIGHEREDEHGLKYPYDVALDSHNNVYVANTHNHSIKVFSMEGEFICQYRNLSDDGRVLIHPTSLAIDAQNLVFVGSSNDDEIAVLDSTNNGICLGFISCPGLRSAYSLHLDRQGNLYISDFNAGKILVV